MPTASSQLAKRASRFIAATPQDTPQALPAEKAAEIAKDIARG